MKKVILLLLFVAAVVSCNSDDDSPAPILGCTDEASLNYNADATQDDGSCAYAYSVDFRFSQSWDGTAVTGADIGSTVFTNQHGEELTIERIRYLLSNFQLTNTDGETTVIDAYNLIDLSENSTMTLNPEVELEEGIYTLSMIYGFNDDDNMDGAYPDLNTASWNWPMMLGGGYHFLQFDGMYNVNSSEPKPFNFHNGTARVSDGVFESNFVEVNFPATITIEGNTTIVIEMNIAEWFKNPHEWDLNVLDTPLMPNYNAQKMMQDNAATVFSMSQD